MTSIDIDMTYWPCVFHASCVQEVQMAQISDTEANAGRLIFLVDMDRFANEQIQ